MFWRSWQELSKQELYDVIQLRLAVFSVEQNCPYQDLDALDQQALHLLAYQDGQLVGYLRLFETLEVYQGMASFGRVCTAQGARSQGLGRQLVASALAYSDQHFKKNIKISAQQYLEKFYQDFGFEIIGGSYLEDGIPHIGMIRTFNTNKAHKD
ncbi:MAG: GNAT family N-acetyltransferase [Kangiellaceae bacterium]|nr:GNAT family N-acetyltransferase [Kangiellaceae bacterium]